MFWVVISSIAVVSMWTAAAVSALNAARTARTPQGAIGWVVFLLSVPLIALPAYLIFGQFRFKGYHRARVDLFSLIGAQTDMQESRDRAQQRINPAPFEAISGLSLCRGNHCTLLIDGPDTFDAVLEAIDNASEYILFQFYIVRSDHLGTRLQEHLIQAARRGVTIWFMNDAIGSHGLPKTYLAALEAAGINLVDPKTSRGPKYRFHINFRNHRKTLVVDGHVGFTGGLNIGDEYLGLDPKFGPWRDTHLRLQGPSVQQLQLSFAEDWQWQTEEPIWELLNWTPSPAVANQSVLIAATGPGDQTANGSMLYFSAITASKERLWVASPYFVPDLDVVAALKHAALRGVDVRILLSNSIDHYLPWLAAFSYFDDLRKAGVRIYRYSEGFMHQKVFLIDDAVAGVGTTNLDNRSFRLNFETMAVMFDPVMAQQLKSVLEQDFANSVEETKLLDAQNWKIRLLSPIARLFAPIL
ncbi:cardiolipin synthase [Pseudophaeobacter leonis]|uniref:cardiolipin synthase n=1 Tax=Pseudophaeobacter leonis TaxID=1144477 RepID=UPI0009F1CB9D|nr:cardiolipin synthase [Pseudophaeobacter leonis]